jgi:hypothetical protein
MPFIEVVLTSKNGKVLNKISLKGKQNVKEWPLYYPQYYPETVTPFIQTDGNLILTGQSFLSIPDSLISRFKFSAQINLISNEVEFYHSYPQQLYGFNSNWEGGLFTEVFPALHPDGNKLIYSFPVSHDLYIADLNDGSYKIVYAGSNFAGTIKSIDHSDPRTTPSETILVHWAKQDMYAAILYDQYRKVYYRFLRKAIPVPQCVRAKRKSR